MRAVPALRIVASIRGDEVRDPLNALAQDIVSELECLHQGHLRRGDFQQAIVGDGDERINVLLELFDALLGALGSQSPLKREGLGDDSHRQHSRLARQARNHGGSAGARAPAHPCRQKDHICVFQERGQLRFGLLGGLPPNLGIPPGS
jgi:hypothetical protein